MYCINLRKSSLGIKDRRTRQLRTATMETSSHRSYSKIDPHQQYLLQNEIEVSDETGMGREFKVDDLSAARDKRFSSPRNPRKSEKISSTDKSEAIHVLKRTFRRSLSIRRSGRKSREGASPSPSSSSSRRSGCQRELHHTRHGGHRKHFEEDEEEDDPLVWTVEEPRHTSPPISFLPLENGSPKTVTNVHPFNDGDDTNLNWKYELKELRQMLDNERVKNQKLTERLHDAENQLRTAKTSQSNEIAMHYSKHLRRLQQEVSQYRDLWQSERNLRNDIEEKFDVLRQEHSKQEERMDILMYHQLPSVVPRFMDIGVVNYRILESYGSVGPYEIGELLGEGYYGSVRIAKRENNKYAVKILKKSRLRRYKDLQQVAIEIHVLKHYRHPGIINLEDIIHAEENIYLVTELCSMDLHKYHNEIGLSEESAKQVIYGILRPLQHMHAHGICHLDLKPENILLTQSSDENSLEYTHVRLCDFGLVSLAPKPDHSKDIVRKGYACGTPGFYAPEMILRNEFEGRRADMWSLGCIILEITLGFTHNWINAYEVADSNSRAFLHGLEYSLDEITVSRYPIHKRLVQLIHNCLSIDDSKRINSSQALIHPWLADVALSSVETSNTNGFGKQRARIYSDRSDLLNTTATQCQ
jgi:serine/threonine protein kinase